MRSIYDIRRANLIYILETRFGGTQAHMASALQMQPGLISRWKGDKSMGGNAARKIEAKLGLDRYWMDKDRDSENSEQVSHDINSVISRNLREWMDKSDTLKTQAKLHKASNVSQSTIQRILSREVDPTASVLDSIAMAFGRKGYEIMLPQVDPRQIFYNRDAYQDLPDEEKAKIRSFIDFIISQHTHKSAD